LAANKAVEADEQTESITCEYAIDNQTVVPLVQSHKDLGFDRCDWLPGTPLRGWL